jgi:hypothetical protein
MPQESPVDERVAPDPWQFAIVSASSAAAANRIPEIAQCSKPRNDLPSNAFRSEAERRSQASMDADEG